MNNETEVEENWNTEPRNNGTRSRGIMEHGVEDKGTRSRGIKEHGAEN